MTKQLTPFQYTLLGTFVLLVMALGGWVMALIAGTGDFWSKKVEIIAHSPEATEIYKGTPVLIRGLQVGQVVGVEIPADDTVSGVFIRLEIDQKYRERIHRDAVIHFKNRGGLLGNQVLDLNPGTSSAGELAQHYIPAYPQPDLAAVTQRLANVADRAEAVVKEAQQGKGTFAKLLNDSELHDEMGGLLKEARILVKNLDTSVKELRADADKSLKKVDLAVDEVRGEMDNLKQMVRKGNEAAETVKQDADAIKALPIIRGYVEDHAALLVRPHCQSQQVSYVPYDLFEGNNAILTSAGKEKLNQVAAWLADNRMKSSEVVVVSFADEKKGLTPAEAKVLTKKQAEVVADYLKQQGGAKISTFSSRKIIPLGAGYDPSPIAADRDKPASRIQIFLFAPQN